MGPDQQVYQDASAFSIPELARSQCREQEKAGRTDQSSYGPIVNFKALLRERLAGVFVPKSTLT